MELIHKYFPHLTPVQTERFEKLRGLYTYWNERVNVISRKDIGHLYEKHVLHSLGIAKFHAFAPATDVLDVGTGGGFPGIPLALLFPDTHFHLIDSIGKKVMVVRQIVSALGLQNVIVEQVRAEQIKNRQYDFIISRAVSKIATFYPWIRGKFKAQHQSRLKNGLLYLKGGHLTEELADTGLKGVKVRRLSKYFDEPFFETKKIVYIPAQ